MFEEEQIDEIQNGNKEIALMNNYDLQTGLDTFFPI